MGPPRSFRSSSQVPVKAQSPIRTFRNTALPLPVNPSALRMTAGQKATTTQLSSWCAQDSAPFPGGRHGSYFSNRRTRAPALGTPSCSIVHCSGALSGRHRKKRVPVSKSTARNLIELHLRD